MLLIGFFICLATAFLARRKGYNPFAWFLAGGILLVAWLILAIFPNITKNNLSPEEKAEKMRTGNAIGVVLSGIVAVLLFFYSRITGEPSGIPLLGIALPLVLGLLNYTASNVAGRRITGAIVLVFLGGTLFFIVIQTISGAFSFSGSDVGWLGMIGLCFVGWGIYTMYSVYKMRNPSAK